MSTDGPSLILFYYRYWSFTVTAFHKTNPKNKIDYNKYIQPVFPIKIYLKYMGFDLPSVFLNLKRIPISPIHPINIMMHRKIPEDFAEQDIALTHKHNIFLFRFPRYVREGFLPVLQKSCTRIYGKLSDILTPRK